MKRQLTTTLSLPVRFGRLLARRLDPRRTSSLEDSLRIREDRWRQRSERLDQRLDGTRQTDDAEPADSAAPDARRGRLRDIGSGAFELAELGTVFVRIGAAIVRGVLRVIGGVLDGLSILDV